MRFSGVAELARASMAGSWSSATTCRSDQMFSRGSFLAGHALINASKHAEARPLQAGVVPAPLRVYTPPGQAMWICLLLGVRR